MLYIVLWALSAIAADRAALAQQLRQDLGVGADAKLTATIQTRLGDIRCELYPDVAPVTVRTFVDLSRGGSREWLDPRNLLLRKDPLYPGTVFHRVIPDFMVQGGDPLGTGSGGPGWQFEDEIDPKVTFDQPGRLAMANAGPGTNGSQFFVTSKPTPHLDGKHTIFGQCAVEVVEKIMKEPLVGSMPRDPVTIDAVKIAVEKR
jgi:peptidyl-prolyl cis-trans isomerase A (cyclophilin A)